MPNPACRTGCQGMQTNDLCMHPGTTVCTKAGNDLNTTVAAIRTALEIAQARAQLTGHCKEVLNLAWPCDSTSAANLPPAQCTSNPRPSLPVSKCRKKTKNTKNQNTPVSQCRRAFETVEVVPSCLEILVLLCFV